MADPYQEALQSLLGLGAERALVLTGPAPLQARLLHGFDVQADWQDQISLGVLERTMQGEPLLVADLARSSFSERWSVQVSGIFSLICVPFWSPSSRVLGILYADTKALRSFTQETLTAVQMCARRLEQSLFGGAPIAAHPPVVVTRSGSAPQQAGVRLGMRKRGPSLPVPQPTPPAAAVVKPGGRRPDGRSLAVLFRSLATMVKAGLGLHRSLAVLAQHEPQAYLRAVCLAMSNRLASGSTLSAAMASQSGVFDSFDCQMVEVGEATGSLDRILEELATFRERGCAARMRLRSALAYPLMITGFSLLVLLLAPPLVLRGQFELLKQSGQPIPWLTACLVGFSDFLCSGPGLLACALAVLGCLAGLRGFRKNPRWQRFFWEKFSRLPVLRRFLLNLGCARLCRSLALTYRVGLPIDRGLQFAFALSGLPQLSQDLEPCLQTLRGGGTVAQSLARSEVIPFGLIALVKAGEESGKLDALLAWIAQIYELEFDTNLQSFVDALQPLVLLGLGIFVGILLVATLMPMLSLVQSL